MKRNISIDLLKGIAIIAVVLYHLGISEYGYLGVDVFFVISGYLVTVGLIKNYRQDKFSYWNFINKRLARLWPGLILIGAVSFILGWFFMMPLHLKLNCESVIGTITYTNNFVQYITGGDYWTSANEFKPLMHTWYIGILMQFYIIIPVFFVIAKHWTKDWYLSGYVYITVLTLLSIFIYVSPLMSQSQDFYMLPSRFFELGIGSLLALVILDENNISDTFITYAFGALLLLIGLLIFGFEIHIMKLRLMIVTIISVTMVGCSNYFNINLKLQKILLPITFLGVISYSLYLSHQVFFAFYRYIVNNLFSLVTYIYILLLTIVIGVILYYLFERPLSQYIAKKPNNIYRINGICLILVIILSTASLYCYKHNGLIRDIPELCLFTGQDNVTPEEYNNAPFSLNVDFEDNGKKNILIIGDSFGRDWANILQESGVDSVMNISYTMYVNENTKKRLAEADYVFVATYLPFFTSYNYELIYPELFNRKFWRVGLKSFGEKFIGNIYNNRHTNEYFETSVFEKEFSKNINLYEKELFKENFIDMMTPIMKADGSIQLFTEDQLLITEDGIHLTKAGAKMYAEKLDVWQYLK